MKALVTGGAGFIAHHLIDYLLEMTDMEVVSLDRLDFSGNLNRLQDVMQDSPHKKRLTIVHHDLKAEINPWIADRIGEVDFIFHLAAGSHVDRSILNPLEFVQDNVIGTLNLLQFARTQNRLRMFLYFSTDEVFGPAPPGVAYKEYDRYNSTNPYSASKAGAEELCVAFRNTYGVPVIVTHTMNVFGPRQHPEKFIPKTIADVRDRRVVSIHSDRECKNAGSRFYIHVADVCDALVALMISIEHRTDVCPKYNIVGEREMTNLEVAQVIAHAQGHELKYELVDFHSSRPGHDLRYALDGSLLAGKGWMPRIPVASRLEEVVMWSLAHPEWLRK